MAPIISVNDAFYVFGGSPSYRGILKLDAQNIWKIVGFLNAIRNGHNVIYDGTHFLVFGGAKSKLATEKCALSNEEVNCIDQSPSLTDYENPALFFVSTNYCNNNL